jgi:phosphoesterase RecJ-like protein
LGLALEDLGKEVQMVVSDPPSNTFRHLAGFAKIGLQADGDFDLRVTVDTANYERVGDALNGEAVDINIDHHETNTNFARINLVDPDAVAVAAILAQNFSEMGLTLTPSIAEALLTGILTDSQGFRTLNTNPAAMRISAELMEAGADLPSLYFEAMGKRSLSAARYWGVGLSKMVFQDQIAWTSLSLADRKAAKYHGRDDADLINVLISVEGVEIAVIFIQQDENTVKVSWRGKGGVDVSRVAALFGGGGHKAAAGAMVSGQLDEVESRVIEATKVPVLGEPVG